MGLTIENIMEEIPEEFKKAFKTVMDMVEPDMPDAETQADMLQKRVTELSTGSDFKVGDIVMLNERGQERYRIPRKSQVALIAKIFDEPSVTGDDEGRPIEINHGLIVVVNPRIGKNNEAVPGPKFKTDLYLVDFTCFTKV